MELRQLRYFVKAAELNNFTEASNQLFITQSTLSQQIKTLEDELGIPLFDRIGKRVRLTEAGHLFLPQAQKTAREAENGKQIIKDLLNLQTGTLSIGTTYGLANLLSDAVIRFSEQFPAIKLEINFGTTSELKLKLDDGSLDFMLSFLPGGDPLFPSTLSLITATTNELSKKKSIALKDLASLHLLLPSKGYSIRNFFDERLKKHEIELDVKMEINDIHTILLLVSSGRWHTVLMNTSLFNHPMLTAVPIMSAGMERAATITWPEGSYSKKSAKLFADFLRVLQP